ncbi:MAG TPA: hypothetical protein PKK12_01495, partial [Candidatus Aminicenantes bacterium]|nr:hypothetical protein [Candidatus Aminicenantes bacterium]
VKKLSDPALLLDVARASADPDTRKAATICLEDRSLLAAIAVDDKDWSVRAAAHEKLGDAQAVAAEVARNSDNSFSREKAVRILDNQAVLARVALQDEKYTVRHEAVSRLNDRSVLEQVIRQDKSSPVVAAARLRLQELPPAPETCAAGRKMNVKAQEMLSGMSLKCPACGTGFNPGAIGLIMAFESIDQGAAVHGPGYACPHCARLSSIQEWYDSTLSLRS